MALGEWGVKGRGLGLLIKRLPRSKVWWDWEGRWLRIWAGRVSVRVLGGTLDVGLVDGVCVLCLFLGGH